MYLKFWVRIVMCIGRTMIIQIKEALKLLISENNELRNIIIVTLKMSFCSVVISSTIGIFLGYMISRKNFILKKIVQQIVNTLMGMPPVVGGLIVFLILSRSGPLGKYQMLFTIKAMIIAQTILITPIVIGLTIPTIDNMVSSTQKTLIGLGINKFKRGVLILYECRKALISIIISAFGRSIAEVGAVQLVGGNIQYKTRVMTTAIMLETNKGNFEFAIALGIILLLISFMINICTSFLLNDTRG